MISMFFGGGGLYVRRELPTLGLATSFVSSRAVASFQQIILEGLSNLRLSHST